MPKANPKNNQQRNGGHSGGQNRGSNAGQTRNFPANNANTSATNTNNRPATTNTNNRPATSGTTSSTQNSAPATSNLATSNAASSNEDMSVSMLMNAIPLRLRTKDGRHVTTYGILDACSNRHFMSEELRAALNLKGVPKTLTIGTVTANKKEVQTTSIIASVEDLERTNSYDLEFDVLNLDHLFEPT